MESLDRGQETSRAREVKGEEAREKEDLTRERQNHEGLNARRRRVSSAPATPSVDRETLAGCGDRHEDLGEVHLEHLDLAALTTDLLDRLFAKAGNGCFALLQILLGVPA